MSIATVPLSNIQEQGRLYHKTNACHADILASQWNLCMVVNLGIPLLDQCRQVAVLWRLNCITVRLYWLVREGDWLIGKSLCRGSTVLRVSVHVCVCVSVCSYLSSEYQSLLYITKQLLNNITIWYQHITWTHTHTHTHTHRQQVEIINEGT